MVGDIFPTSIRLELFDFGGKLVFHLKLKFHKTIKNFRFIIEGINPIESREVINENNIISKATNRSNGGCPNIRMN
jgi:hypothetical protein